MATKIQNVARLLSFLVGSECDLRFTDATTRPPVEYPFKPYVYSRSEIRRLLTMVRIGQKSSNCKIEAETVRAIILFLYGTGALLSEALTLQRNDLDFRKHTVTFRGSRPYRSRTIPMCS